MVVLVVTGDGGDGGEGGGDGAGDGAGAGGAGAGAGARDTDFSSSLPLHSRGLAWIPSDYCAQDTSSERWLLRSGTLVLWCFGALIFLATFDLYNWTPLEVIGNGRLQRVLVTWNCTRGDEAS